MSGSASIVWTLPFTSRFILAMGAYLPDWRSFGKGVGGLRRPHCLAEFWIIPKTRLTPAPLERGVLTFGDSTRLTEPHDLLTSRRSHEAGVGTSVHSGERPHGCKQVSHLLLGHAAGDEHEPAHAAFVRPARQLDRRVRQVLHDLHQHRAAAARNVEEALH